MPRDPSRAALTMSFFVRPATRSDPRASAASASFAFIRVSNGSKPISRDELKPQQQIPAFGENEGWGGNPSARITAGRLRRE
jgi:hypothetical protein